MTTPFEDQHSVWTYNDDPEWRARNAGAPDMLLTVGLSLGNARVLVDRLMILLPGNVFEVKDIRNKVVSRFEVRPAITPGQPRKRRSLGTREQ